MTRTEFHQTKPKTGHCQENWDIVFFLSQKKKEREEKVTDFTQSGGILETSEVGAQEDGSEEHKLAVIGIEDVDGSPAKAASVGK